MKQLVVALSALVASCIVTASAQAVDVCGYRVTAALGVLCPIHVGTTVCLSVATNIGPCDAPIQCFGSTGFFCNATLEPVSGPEPQCPFSSVRPVGFSCFKPQSPVVRTATETPIVIETPTFTPTGTEAPTAPSTATATAETPTGTPTGTAEATITATETGTPTGTPTGTAEATVTATEGPTGTPTGTAAALVRIRFR